MTGKQARWRRLLVDCSAAAVLLAGALQPAFASPAVHSRSAPLVAISEVVGAATSAAPGLAGQVHRLVTRAERALRRFASTLLHAAVVWLWITLSAAVFLLIAAVSSAADFRMLNLRQQDSEALSRYLGYGMRTFFRVLRDRRTPYVPRSILVVALLYWLLPLDLIADSPLWPGFLDDVVVTVLAAKSFVHFCPDSVVASHAAAVQTRA